MCTRTSLKKMAKQKHGASMVCLGGVAAERQNPKEPRHGQEYGGRAERGAVLNSIARHIGRHRTRIYTTKAGCSNSGGQQRMLPCALAC